MAQTSRKATLAKKGSLIGVVGRIQTRTYDNQQGQRVYVTEVVADNFQLLESKAATEIRAHQDRTNFNLNQEQTTLNNVKHLIIIAILIIQKIHLMDK